MKVALIIALISAPLLKGQTYEVQVKSCSGDKIIVETQSSTYSVSLFNIDIKSKEGMEYSCKRIKEASKVEIMIDRYATVVDHISAWVYVDDSILQKELVERSYARILIKSPEYGHYDQLMEAAVQANAQENEQIYKSREFNRSRANQFLTYNIVGLVAFCAFALSMQMLKKRRKL